MNLRASEDSTRWSRIERARSPEPAVRSRAAEELAELYRMPILRWAQREGLGQEDSEDITQQVLVFFLSEETLAGLAPGGSVRGLLKTVLKRRAADFFRQRGRSREVPIDAIPAPVSAAPSPDEAFDAELARRIYALTWKEVRERWVADWERKQKQPAVVSGRELFGLLQAAAQEDTRGGRYARIEQTAGINESALRQMVRRLRADFRQSFSSIVASYVTNDPSQGRIEEEVGALKAALRNRKS